MPRHFVILTLPIFQLCLLLITASAACALETNSNNPAEPYYGWQAMPDENFSPLLAGIREPQFSTRFEMYRQSSEDFDAAQVSFGDTLPIVGYGFADNSALQFAIDGALYALFNLDKPSYDLYNTDYFFGISLTYARGDFSSRFRLNHASSHLGDEFLLENPEFDRNNSSFEDTELLLSYQYGAARIYGGGGSIFRSNSLDDFDPLHFRSGFEFNHPVFGIHWLTGLDLNIAQRTNWDLNRSVIFGAVLLSRNASEVRLLFNYYGGDSPQGQFFRDKVEYYSIGLYYIV